MVFRYVVNSSDAVEPVPYSTEILLSVAGLDTQIDGEYILCIGTFTRP